MTVMQDNQVLFCQEESIAEGTIVSIMAPSLICNTVSMALRRDTKLRSTQTLSYLPLLILTAYVQLKRSRIVYVSAHQLWQNEIVSVSQTIRLELRSSAFLLRIGTKELFQSTSLRIRVNVFVFCLALSLLIVLAFLVWVTFSIRPLILLCSLSYSCQTYKAWDRPAF